MRTTAARGMTVYQTTYVVVSGLLDENLTGHLAVWALKQIAAEKEGEVDPDFLEPLKETLIQRGLLEKTGAIHPTTRSVVLSMIETTEGHDVTLHQFPRRIAASEPPAPR